MAIFTPQRASITRPIKCTQCGAHIWGAEPKDCYHRCRECGFPYYGFVKNGEVDDYRCLVCDQPFVYSWSLLTDFVCCPRFALYAHDLSRQMGTQAMDFGGALHEAIAYLKVHRDLEAAIDLFREVYVDPSAGLPETERASELRTHERGEGILRTFWQRFADDELMTRPSYVEKVAAVELAPGILYSAKIDDLSLEAQEATDYKTTSWFNNDRFLETWHMNHQFTGYCVVPTALTGINIEKVRVVVIKVSKGRKTPPPGVSKKDWVEYQDAYDFKVILQRRQEWHKQDFMRTIKFYVKWWNDCRKEGYWPQNSKYCWHYQRKCIYFDICRMPFERVFDELRYSFPLRVWDPMTGEGEILRERESARIAKQGG